MKLRISEEDMKKIRMQGIESNEDHFLYGEFRMPGVLTNDLANNKEFNTTENNAISMSHIKRVARINNEIRVMICSKFCWENELKPEIKAKIKELA